MIDWLQSLFHPGERAKQKLFIEYSISNCVWLFLLQLHFDSFLTHWCGFYFNWFYNFHLKCKVKKKIWHFSCSIVNIFFLSLFQVAISSGKHIKSQLASCSSERCHEKWCTIKIIKCSVTGKFIQFDSISMRHQQYSFKKKKYFDIHLCCTNSRDPWLCVNLCGAHK